MQILKRRSDAIYLTEMGAFIARRINQQYIMKLQNADTARHTTGTGSSSLMIPAIMIGTEQAIVTRIVKMMLNSKVIAASNLDMMSLFK